MDRDKKQLKIFGYGLSVLSSIVLIKIYSFFPSPAFVVFAVSFLMGLIALTTFRCHWLNAFYRRWMKTANAMGHVVTVFLLTVFFYAVFGFLGIILRLLKKDLLDQRMDASADSYWLSRENKDFAKDRYTRQF